LAVSISVQIAAGRRPPRQGGVTFLADNKDSDRRGLRCRYPQLGRELIRRAGELALQRVDIGLSSSLDRERKSSMARDEVATPQL
jgi:hypothetical protein